MEYHNKDGYGWKCLTKKSQTMDEIIRRKFLIYENKSCPFSPKTLQLLYDLNTFQSYLAILNLQVAYCTNNAQYYS
jgi:hypothetical protein